MRDAAAAERGSRIITAPLCRGNWPGVITPVRAHTGELEQTAQWRLEAVKKRGEVDPRAPLQAPLLLYPKTLKLMKIFSPALNGVPCGARALRPRTERCLQLYSCGVMPCSAGTSRRLCVQKPAEPELFPRRNFTKMEFHRVAASRIICAQLRGPANWLRFPDAAASSGFMDMPEDRARPNASFAADDPVQLLPQLS
ncbi:hypothetical protein AOLI_G00030050 [Acnodon oligacanthus]